MAFYPLNELLMNFTGGLANRDTHRSVTYSSTVNPTTAGPLNWFQVGECWERGWGEICSGGRRFVSRGLMGCFPLNPKFRKISEISVGA